MNHKHLSYSLGGTLVAIVIVAFWLRQNDIDRIDRTINQKVAAVTEAEEKRIRVIVQHEVAKFVRTGDISQTVTIKCPDCDEVKRATESVDQQTLARILEIKDRISSNRINLTSGVVE